MTTELEKTQLEIARLQLEQERHKLAQLQKRQRVVDDLGQGTVAVSGAAVRGSKAVLQWAAKALLVWTVGMLWFAFVRADRVRIEGADFLYRMDYALGQMHPWEVVVVAVIAFFAGFAKFGSDKSGR